MTLETESLSNFVESSIFIKKENKLTKVGHDVAYKILG